MPITKIVLVRHGETEANRANIVSGHLDTPLTELGRQQAAETAESLKHINFDAVYASDLQRAVETAQIISGRPVPAANRHKLLRERSFGSLEGGSNVEWKKLHAQHSEILPEHERWSRRYRPDIESDYDIHTRFKAALTDIAKKHPGETVLVVIHGGLIRTTLVGLGHAQMHQLKSGSFRNGGHVHLNFDGQVYSITHVDGLTMHEGAE